MLGKYCHWRTDEELPQLPSFQTKSQVLEITQEKHFKVSHRKESCKAEGLARINCSITGYRQGGEGGEKHCLFLTQEMGAKTQNSDPHIPVLYWRVGGILMVKDNGSGRLRWLLKQGGVILAHKTETIGVVCFRTSLC
jgi:hypothetical protein